MKIENLDLSIRTFNLLKRAGINTVEELSRLSDVELKHIRNLGKRSFDEIKAKLEENKVIPKTIPWNDIKDGLPPLGKALIVTVYDSLHDRRETRYPVIYRQSYFHNGYGFYVYGAEEHILLPEYSEVLAWIEIPSPYKNEGTENE